MSTTEWMPLTKTASGARGLDEILDGGLPEGRTTLICGGPGCGKTLFALSFIAHGLRIGENGVVVTFEESPSDLIANSPSLGVDLGRAVSEGKLSFSHIVLDRNEFKEIGNFDLSPLIIRIGQAIKATGAKRVVIDTPEALFSAFDNTAILRSELRRLFSFLKEQGVTSVVTAEPGIHTFTRDGIEEFVSDCVIWLDHRVQGQLSTRRVRVVKYRGSWHGTNEYPFLITREGIYVAPITSVGLNAPAPVEQCSCGIYALDRHLSGGLYRGSSVLISGLAGSGKSSLSAHFADSACSRGERVTYIAFEESQDLILRNMRSIGIDLGRWIDAGLLRILAVRPTVHGLEMHLMAKEHAILDFEPHLVAIDPISSLLSVGHSGDVRSMLTRLLDMAKMRSITTICTYLASGQGVLSETEIGISSIMDAWVALLTEQHEGRRRRLMRIVKARGLSHSLSDLEYTITDRGINMSGN